MPAKSTFGSASVIPYSSSSSSYKISRSLRFNSADSAYLSRTPASTSTRRIMTVSAWVKISSLTAGIIRGIYSGGTGNFWDTFCLSNTTDDVKIFFDGGNGAFLTSSPLFRDLSAWYHFVFSVDTTQATESNRVRFFVNGVQQTLTGTQPTQDYQITKIFHSSFTQYIGATDGGAGGLNGYLTEFYAIDGQALDPSSFGYTDSITGSWMPKKYVGTYGTNGFYLPFSDSSSTTTRNLLTYSEDFANGSWTNYQSTETSNAAVAPNGTTTADKLIPDPGSLGGQLYRNYSAVDNTTYTFSVYAKAAEYTQSRLYIQKKATSATYDFADYDLSSATVTATYGSPTSTSIVAVGNGWHRISISSNVGIGGTATPSVNIQHLGSAGNGSNGILLWGAQLEDSGTLGPYLRTDASATASTLRLGSDSSVSTGGYNSWFVNNFSVTAGAGNDSLVDSPTDYGVDTGLGGEVRGNYATLNPISTIKGTIIDGALRTNAGDRGSISTIGMTSGKWYCEMYVTALGAESSVGISRGINIMNTYVGSSSDSWGYYYNGLKYNNASSASYGSSYTTGDTIGAAFDADAGTIVFYKNGTSQGTAYTSLTNGPYYFATSGRSSTSANDVTMNFGQQPWKYAPPAGYKALCTTNLPIPPIKKSSTRFDAVKYTGNATGQTISSFGFSPNLVWLKSRTNATYNYLFDTVRGINTFLFSNTTTTDTTTTSLISFNSNGFSLGADPAPDTSTGFNASGSNQIAWGWSRSIIAGMDIVGYVGDDNSGRTISHNLGVTPKMIIVKNRTTVSDWPVYHANLTASNVVFLQLTNAQGAISTYAWGAVSSASSTTFTVIAGNTDIRNVNKSGDNYVAYCFSDVEGFSKFGSYTGNGLEDGPFVYCGFRPRWVMMKRTDAAFENWQIQDSVRSVLNPVQNNLFPNLSQAEQIGGADRNFDFVSNGFKLRGNNTGTNASGGTYIFAAFAEAPFKYARAR